MTYINSGGRTTWVPSPKAQITKKYHVKDTQYAAGYHTGLDIAVEGSSGQKIVWAPKVKGKVVKSGMDPNGYGHYVIIESDNNRQWLLAHMKDAGPKVGTILMQGDKIGNIGASGHVSGPHLHIEEGKKGSDWQYAVGKNPKIGFTPNNPNMHSPNGHTIAALSFGGGMQQTSASELNMLAGATGGAEENLSTKVGGVGKQHNSDNPAQTVKGSYKQNNPKKGVDELKISGNGNGDNLTRLFQKAYGDRANSVMNTTLGIMRSHGGGEIKEIGKPGQYGYTIAVKTKDGWSTDINAVKNKLVTYVPDSFEGQNLPSDKLTLAATGGLETSLSNRFARAFHGGDTQKGNQSLMAAYNALKAKNPGKVRFVGTPGQVGSYIQVKVNGEWTSNSDEVAKQLSAYAKPEQSKGSANLSKQQKDLLAGANGNAVLNSFINKYGSVELAQKNLKIAMNSFEKANPGNDIRYFGNIGQPGFYIEVKTKDGWVNGTNRILNKLEDHMPKVAATPPVNSPSNASTPESAFAPGATGPNQSASPAQPATSSTSSPEESAETASPSQPVASSNVEPSEEQGLQIGFEAGSPEFQQSENSLNEWAANRTQETESFKPSKEKPASVDLGQAARKSEAMMAFDLDGSGDISAAEKALMANGDQNNNGIVGEYGLKKFVAQADTNNSGLVSQAEVKAYNVVDTNNNNKLSAREIKAYGNVDANNDGDITKKEAKAMVKDLRAQVDLSKQEKKDLDLAKQYLAKSNGKSGGADNVDAQVAALVNSQPKHDKKGDTGPKGATKKNK